MVVREPSAVSPCQNVWGLEALLNQTLGPVSALEVSPEPVAEVRGSGTPVVPGWWESEAGRRLQARRIVAETCFARGWSPATAKIPRSRSSRSRWTFPIRFNNTCPRGAGLLPGVGNPIPG
ncbi:hypothetical protein QAD02_019150 [Eretmocerus hayati]|uniref:Uncharacterized protein n=1 Tax=Eretmocerus hayati TaxID=131215 RepID=A0ACC2PK12_9HYME|nr:hypothetical protein QAD02_019150 [Eretmocerus hayati]